MTNVFPTIEETQNGSELVTELNQWRTSILELHGATSRPSYAVAGTMWRDTTSATSQGIYVYDGSDDILIGTMDVDANKFYPGAASAAAALTNLGLTATAAELNQLDGNVFTADVVPSADSTYDLGSSSAAWALQFVDELRVDLVAPLAGGTARNLVRGTAAAWVNFNGTGTIAARDSINVSSLTDNGVGAYTVNLSNNFGAADYASTVGSTLSVSFSASRTASGQHAVGSFFVHCRNLANNTDSDADELSGVAHGDLA